MASDSRIRLVEQSLQEWNGVLNTTRGIVKDREKPQTLRGDRPNPRIIVVNETLAMSIYPTPIWLVVG